MFPANANLTYWPASPVTETTAKGDPSFTVALVTVSGRSSFGKVPALAARTTDVIGAVTVGTTPLTGADSSTPEVAGLLATNTVPVPSSVMVAVPSTTAPVVGVTVNLNVSLLSAVTSSAIVVRTSNLPLLSNVILPLV